MKIEKESPWGQKKTTEILDSTRVPERLHQEDYQVILIAGPNAAGKGTLIKALLECNEGFTQVLRTTTKQISLPEFEENGYNPVENGFFGKMINEGEFIEWGIYGQGYYGTRAIDIAESLKRGRKVLVDVDLDAGIVLRNFFESLGVSVYDCFILPISLEEFKGDEGINKALEVLRERLHFRGRKEPPAEIEGRIRNARRMLLRANEYRYIIPNVQEDVGEAVDTILRLLE